MPKGNGSSGCRRTRAGCRSFTPPAWLFGPVWTVLYVLIAVAGWRVWQRDRTGWPMKLWLAQLALNFLWTPVFFGAHQIAVALFVILFMLAAILAFHWHVMAAGSGRGFAVHALCRVGGVCFGAECGDPCVELGWRRWVQQMARGYRHRV